MHRVAREPLDNLEFDRELEEIYSLFDDVCYRDILYPEVPDVLRRCGRWGLRQRWLPPPVWRESGRC